MNFVAIDFETANSSRDSACALGAVIVKNSEIVDRRYTLINPQVSFERFCSHIHGINEDVVTNSPTFYDIYPMLYKMLCDQTVVAHNAPFDVAVLRESCVNRGLAFPSFSSFCSVEMSRKAWPQLPQHRLNALCSHFNLPLKHHNAVEDATACAMLVLLCAKELGANSIDELNKKLAQKTKNNQVLLKKREKEILKKIQQAKNELQ